MFCPNCKAEVETKTEMYGRCPLYIIETYCAECGTELAREHIDEEEEDMTEPDADIRNDDLQPGPEETSGGVCPECSDRGIHFKQGGALHGCPLCNQVGIPARDGSGNYRCASGHLWHPETQAKISQAEASEKPPAADSLSAKLASNIKNAKFEDCTITDIAAAPAAADQFVDGMTDGQSEVCRDMIEPRNDDASQPGREETSGGVCPECFDNGVVCYVDASGAVSQAHLCRRCFPRPLRDNKCYITAAEAREIARQEVAFLDGKLAGHLDTWQASAREIAREEASCIAARAVTDGYENDGGRLRHTIAEIAREESAKLLDEREEADRRTSRDVPHVPMTKPLKCESATVSSDGTVVLHTQPPVADGGEAVDNGDVLERLRTMAVAGRDFVTVGDAITELAALRQQVAELQQYKSNLVHAYAKQGSELNGLTVERDELSKRVEELSVLDSHVDLRESRRTVRVLSNAIAAHCACSNADHGGLEHCIHDIETLNHDLAATQWLQAEVAELREKLARMTEAADGWRDEKHELYWQVVELKQQLAARRVLTDEQVERAKELAKHANLKWHNSFTLEWASSVEAFLRSLVEQNTESKG